MVKKLSLMMFSTFGRSDNHWLILSIRIWSRKFQLLFMREVSCRTFPSPMSSTLRNNNCTCLVVVQGCYNTSLKDNYSTYLFVCIAFLSIDNSPP